MTRRPTRADRWITVVVALLALVVAWVGSAVAVAGPQGAVVSASIRDGAVRTPDLAGDGIAASRIAPRTVGGDDLARGSVGGRHLGGLAGSVAQSEPVEDADAVANGGNHAIASAAASCPAGATVLGGEVIFVRSGVPVTENVSVQASHPFADGWRAQGIVDIGDAPAVRLAVQVRCLLPDAGSAMP